MLWKYYKFNIFPELLVGECHTTAGHPACPPHYYLYACFGKQPGWTVSVGYTANCGNCHAQCMPLFCLVQCARWIAMEEENKAKHKIRKWVNKWLLERENKGSYGGLFSEFCSEDNFKDSSFNVSNVAWKQFLCHSCSCMKLILRSIEQDVPGRAVSENISHPVSTPLSQTYLLNDSWTATGWNHTLHLQCATGTC